MNIIRDAASQAAAVRGTGASWVVSRNISSLGSVVQVAGRMRTNIYITKYITHAGRLHVDMVTDTQHAWSTAYEHN